MLIVGGVVHAGDADDADADADDDDDDDDMMI